MTYIHTLAKFQTAIRKWQQLPKIVRTLTYIVILATYLWMTGGAHLPYLGHGLHYCLKVGLLTAVIYPLPYVYLCCRLVFGLLYPAYASYKAVKTKNVKEYVKWMMYWIVFALFCAVEIFSDVFLSWCPFYYEVKMIFVFWLLSPVTKGSSFLYKKFIHPQLSKREKEIDEAIALARTRGYSTLMTLGHKGLTYATNVVVTTAMKDHVYLQGQTTLVEHIKKSYSTNDLRIHPARGGTDDIDGAMIIDSDEEFEDRLLQDNHELDNRDIEVRRTHKKRLREHNSLMRSNSDATDIRLRRMGKTNSALSRLEEADHEHSITDDVATEKDDTNKEEGMQETVTEEIIYYSPRKAGHYTSKEVKSDPYATLPRTRSRQRPRLNQH